MCLHPVITELEFINGGIADFSVFSTALVNNRAIKSLWCGVSFQIFLVFLNLIGLAVFMAIA